MMVPKWHATHFLLNAYKPNEYHDKDILPLLKKHLTKSRAALQNLDLRSELGSICDFIINTSTSSSGSNGQGRLYYQSHFRDEVVGLSIDALVWLRKPYSIELAATCVKGEMPPEAFTALRMLLNAADFHDFKGAYVYFQLQVLRSFTDDAQSPSLRCHKE